MVGREGATPRGPETCEMMTDIPEIMEVTTRRVSCVGQGGALGHPLVYLTIGPKGWVECPYCDRRFVLKDGAGDDAH